MRRAFLLTLLLALVAVPTGVVAADEPAASTPGPAKEVLDAWNYIGGKLVAMAEDWPEEKYDYRPTPEVRTFAEQLLHIAGSSYLFIDTAMGKEAGPEDLPREKYRTKAAVVAVLKKSVEEGAALIRAAGDAGMPKPFKFPFGDGQISQSGFWMAQVEHAGEHYGNLVVYYRLNGVVPPASRQSGN